MRTDVLQKYEGKFYEPHNSWRKGSDAVLCVQEQGRLATCSRFLGFKRRLPQVYPRVWLVHLPEDHVVIGKDTTTVGSSVPLRPPSITDRLPSPFIQHN
ncbi:unnamed protein product [Penicillium roqueforti FM164]|uniref:Genomic scaffold, ProqFM164S02 n=1 Tax=Penicillium roqueforti (strain FM164) TaxID=1365484 RepID=W6QBB8_PENRF|nr:unnamed protein product [Penicillium roqueforti FM164]